MNVDQMMEALTSGAKPTLTYRPLSILSSMREKKKALADELFNGVLPEHMGHVFEVAWREACLDCLEEIRTTAMLLDLEKSDWKPAKAYLERVYDHILKNNALSPFVNYEKGSE